MVLLLLAQATLQTPEPTMTLTATPLPVDVAHLPDDSIYVKVSAIATLIATIMTFVAVAIGWYYNKRMFDESRANNRQTRLDVQLDRESGWKPHLAFDHPPIQAVATERVVAVTNIGKGPALECRYIARLPVNPPRYCRAPLFAVGAESTLEKPRFVQELDATADADSWKLAQRAFEGLLHDHNEVLLCSDAFGNRWRFVRGRGQPDGPHKERASASRAAPAPTHWWQGWKGSGQPRWLSEARKAEQRAADEARMRIRRRDARAAYGEFLDRYNDFAAVRGILGRAAGTVGAALEPDDNNTIRAFGNWVETVAERIEHADLDHAALVKNGLFDHLITFRSEVRANPAASTLMQSWPYLDALV